MSCLCLTLPMLAAMLCHATPCHATPCHAVPHHAMLCINPRGPSHSKGRADPTVWPHATLITFGNGTLPQLGHGPEAMETISVEMWAFKIFFSWQKVGVVGGQRFRGNLKLHGSGFCHSDKDLCRHIRYQMILVLHCVDNNKSVHPLSFIFMIRKMKGKKAKCLPILPDNLPVVEL